MRSFNSETGKRHLTILAVSLLICTLFCFTGIASARTWYIYEGLFDFHFTSIQDDACIASSSDTPSLVYGGSYSEDAEAANNLTLSGKNYIAQKFGHYDHPKYCYVYSGLSWTRYDLDGTNTAETGGTAKILNRLYVTIITDYVQINGVNYTFAGLTAANGGTPIDLDDITWVASNDGEPTGEAQYCYTAEPTLTQAAKQLIAQRFGSYDGTKYCYVDSGVVSTGIDIDGNTAYSNVAYGTGDLLNFLSFTNMYAKIIVRDVETTWAELTAANGGTALTVADIDSVYDEDNTPAAGKTQYCYTPELFDTSSGTYPSISGTHYGTITPSYNITVSKLYTYPCSGTGGHTEYVKILRGSEVIAEKTWSNYTDDWQNLTFNNSFTLYANETYNYTIRTGSYPQIIHESPYNATGGVITCEEFLDINGKQHEGWIPAIRLS